MAGKSTKKRGKARGAGRAPRGRRWALAALFLCLLALAGLFGKMYLSARVVRLCPAELYLSDLPAQFDGATALFLSDFNLRGRGDARAAAKLLDRLGALEVDLLLLGGDYLSDGAGEGALNVLTAALARFPARLGKFAVLGEEDSAEALEAAFASAGVMLLVDACATVEQGGAELILAGLSDASAGDTPFTQIGRYFDGDECTLVLAHNPSSYVGVRVSEARGGGAWADAVLSGHNLGGQIRAFGRTLHTLPEDEARTLAGWFYDGDLPLLVSQGLNCKGAPLRLGSRSEVWLIELRAQQPQVVLPDLR